MKCALFVFAASVVALPVLAREIRLDFSNFYPPGGNWNVASTFSGTVTNLIDWDTGTGTGVDVSYSFSNYAPSLTNWTGGTLDWVVDAAGDDLFLVGGGSTDITFSGLIGDAYDVELLIAYTSDNNYRTTYRIDGQLADRTYQSRPVTVAWDWHDDGKTAADWLIWDSVAPTNGDIQIDLIYANVWLGASAVRLKEANQVFPEPGSGVLIVLSAMAMAAGRRRRPAC